MPFGTVEDWEKYGQCAPRSDDYYTWGWEKTVDTEALNKPYGKSEGQKRREAEQEKWRESHKKFLENQISLYTSSVEQQAFNLYKLGWNDNMVFRLKELKKELDEKYDEDEFIAGLREAMRLVELWKNKHKEEDKAKHELWVERGRLEKIVEMKHQLDCDKKKLEEYEEEYKRYI